MILVISFFTTLGLLELLGWLRESEKLRDIPIHDICSDLGPSRSMALSLFHAITGSDTISHFLECCKKTAGASWQNTPGLTGTLLALTNAPPCFSLGSLHMQWNDLSLYRIVKDVVWLRSMKPGIVFFYKR